MQLFAIIYHKEAFFTSSSCVLFRCTHCNYCNECIPRRRGHCHLLGTCVGYFNHRYFFVSAVYCLFYSANTVAISIIFYNRILHDCEHPSTTIGQYPINENYEGCPLLFSFLLSAFCNFFMLILTIIILTVESEVIVSGKMGHEKDTRNYDRGFKNNLICTLGKHWYFACLCPIVKSTLPDMHAVLFCDVERPMPFAARF